MFDNIAEGSGDAEPSWWVDSLVSELIIYPYDQWDLLTRKQNKFQLLFFTYYLGDDFRAKIMSLLMDTKGPCTYARDIFTEFTSTQIALTYELFRERMEKVLMNTDVVS